MFVSKHQEKREKLVAEARAEFDKIEEGKLDETEAKAAEERHDKLMGDLDALDAQIAREKRQYDAEQAEEERRSRHRPNGRDGRSRATDEPGSDGEERSEEEVQAEYRDAFFALMRNGASLDGLSTEERDLLRKGYIENRTQTAGSDAAGGYTVPTTLANKIIETMKDWGPMYDPGVTDEMVTSSGNPFDFATNDNTGGTGAALDEGADLVDDGSGDLVFGEKSLSAYTYGTPWLKISWELMQDSAFDLEAFIARALGESLGRLANAQLTVGDGVDDPNGIVTAAPQGKAAAAAAAIAADELIDLQHSVNAAYRRSPKCGWMFRDTTLATIRKLKDGQGNYLWQMGDVRVGAPSLILEKPYHVNDDVPAIATGNKSVLFGDLGRYIVRKVGRPRIGTVRERFWPKVGMAGLIRFDGELLDAAAVKALVQA